MVLADESLAGLFHIYNSAAEFMIIVLKPWQRALCPGRLGAFVIPSAALNFSLLPGGSCGAGREAAFLHGENKTQKFLSPPRDTREEVHAKEELTLGADAAGDRSQSICIPETVLMFLFHRCFGGPPTWYPRVFSSCHGNLLTGYLFPEGLSSPLAQNTRLLLRSF